MSRTSLRDRFKGRSRARKTVRPETSWSGRVLGATDSSAGGAVAARPASQRAGGGAIPTPALHYSKTFRPKETRIVPIPSIVARSLCRREHYLHSYPGGSLLNFGVFVGRLLLGVVVLGAGPFNVYSFFDGAQRRQVLCLTRLWLDDRLGRNSESRTLATILRLGKTYRELLIDDDEFRRQKRLFEDRLASLVVPDADAAVNAGKLLEDLPLLWDKADLGERRRILMTMLDAVYVDTVEEKRIVAIRPKPAFRPFLDIATTRRGSGIVLVTEKDLQKANQPPPGGAEADLLCFWWRRGRVELPVQETLPLGCTTGLAG